MLSQPPCQTRIVIVALVLGAGCSGPLPALPEILPTLNALRAGSPRIEFNHPFASTNGQTLRMDVFFPTDPSQPAPVVVLIHGGFWLFGDRTSMLDWATDLATQGYVAVSVDYRLLGDGGTYPAPVLDVLTAIAHVRSQAVAWNLDPDRIALLGVSAGGHLALESGMPPDPQLFDASWPSGEPTGVRAIIDLNGPTDFTADFSTAQLWQIWLVTSFLGIPREQAPELWREASPVTYARSDGPPVMILHGTLDPIVPVSQARALNAALDAAGQPHVYIEIPGAGHGWGSVWDSVWTQEHRGEILDFLQTHLQ